MSDFHQVGLHASATQDAEPGRRRIVMGALATSIFAALARPAPSQEAPSALHLTPQCQDHDEPTISSSEGPFFRPRSPLRHDLTTPSLAGQRIVIGGFVLDTGCRPLSNVLVEAWQANDTGEYDQRGFLLRGHHRTDEDGRWWFRTVVPGPYGPRTRHIHFKLQHRGGDLLTTQLFFPNEPLNQSDYQFDDRLLMSLGQGSGFAVGRFDFVL